MQEHNGAKLCYLKLVIWFFSHVFVPLSPSPAPFLFPPPTPGALNLPVALCPAKYIPSPSEPFVALSLSGLAKAYLDNFFLIKIKYITLYTF